MSIGILLSLQSKYFSVVELFNPDASGGKILRLIVNSYFVYACRRIAIRCRNMQTQIFRHDDRKMMNTLPEIITFHAAKRNALIAVKNAKLIILHALGLCRKRLGTVD